MAIIGLAPAAHGANRTGRMFTGDRSGDFLYAALHRTGFANQPTSDHRGDGLTLTGAWITAPVRCAPPANKPTPTERDTCRPWLERELALLANLQVFVVLGQFAYQAMTHHLGVAPPQVRPRRRGARPAPARRSSARTTSASRTPSPASSPNPCSTTSSNEHESSPPDNPGATKGSDPCERSPAGAEPTQRPPGGDRSAAEEAPVPAPAGSVRTRH